VMFRREDIDRYVEQSKRELPDVVAWQLQGRRGKSSRTPALTACQGTPFSSIDATKDIQSGDCREAVHDCRVCREMVGHGFGQCATGACRYCIDRSLYWTGNLSVR
jgi:hypothetical protein